MTGGLETRQRRREGSSPNLRWRRREDESNKTKLPSEKMHTRRRKHVTCGPASLSRAQSKIDRSAVCAGDTETTRTAPGNPLLHFDVLRTAKNSIQRTLIVPLQQWAAAAATLRANAGRDRLGAAEARRCFRKSSAKRMAKQRWGGHPLLPWAARARLNEATVTLDNSCLTYSKNRGQDGAAANGAVLLQEAGDVFHS